MQTVVFIFQFIHTLQNLICHIPRGISGLLLYGEHHAGVAVDLGIHVCGVIGNADISHIRQTDGCKSVQLQIQKDQIPQTVHILHLISYSDQILLVVLRHVACRHGKVLCREDTLNHIRCQDRI